MADDQDRPSSVEPKKAGFFRRLFGTAPTSDREAYGEPGLEAPDPGPEPGIMGPSSLGSDDTPLDPLERLALEAALARPLPAIDAPPIPIELDPAPEDGPTEEEGAGWWTRLRQGLSRSSHALRQGIVDIFAKRKLDAGTLEELEDVLIRADLGVAMASRITAAIGNARYEKGIEASDVQAVLASEIEAVLSKVAIPLTIDPAQKPFVVLVVGVNGSGKTTTIGKLAAKLIGEGKTVTLGAGDTFRAAAIEQLRIWGARLGAPVISRDQGSDAAGLAFDAVKAAQESRADVLLIDTAGRLQNRAELMEELSKVIRVIRKVEPSAPHAVLLVLDATVGQNALNQVEIFTRIAGVTGLVMTKLDGTARGGILVAVAEKFALPVHYIGVGEGVADLEPFEASDFARAIAGMDD